MLVAWGAAHVSAGLVWAVFAGVMILGATVAALRRTSLREDAREHWRSWLAAEAVFLAAFFAFLLIRAYNPDLWHHPQGGEKPMEIAYLTAVTRSTIMPPYDPWFAGGSLNYYYMGWFFLSVPIRALKIVPEVAFNLGVPTYAALASSVAFTIVHSLVGLGARAREAGAAVSRRPAILAGIAGAVLLVGIGNLDGAHQWIERLQAVNTWGLAEGTPVLGGAVGVIGGLWAWLVDGAELPRFDWWRSSRVHFGVIDITEFPFWSMLFADLHPHLMGLPFFGSVIALVIAYCASVRARLRGQTWVLAVVLGLAVGLRGRSTWDFPTVVLVAAVGASRWDRSAGRGPVATATLGRCGSPRDRRRCRVGGVLALHLAVRDVRPRGCNARSPRRRHTSSSSTSACTSPLQSSSGGAIPGRAEARAFDHGRTRSSR
jgi:uncharacterized membrane protein